MGDSKEEEEDGDPLQGRFPQQHIKMVSGMTNCGHSVREEHVLLEHSLMTYLAPDRNPVRFLLTNLKRKDVVYIPAYIL